MFLESHSGFLFGELSLHGIFTLPSEEETEAQAGNPTASEWQIWDSNSNLELVT